MKLFSRVKYTYFAFFVKFLGFWIFGGNFRGSRDFCSGEVVMGDFGRKQFLVDSIIFVRNSSFSMMEILG